MKNIAIIYHDADFDGACGFRITLRQLADILGE